ncbi:hypothetical protein [Fischerella sp. PCC 9605]|nr:hypothetical protein [Fischerella sp. PCC 9605]
MRSIVLLNQCIGHGYKPKRDRSGEQKLKPLFFRSVLFLST